MKNKLTEEALLTAFIRLFGWRRSAAIMGWAALAVLVAPPDADRAWFLGHGPFAQATRYRHVRDLLIAREYLLAQGYDVDGDVEPVGDAERLMQELAS